MFNNYRYYLVFSEECNISRAAERLFISHQNLSKYLSNLEKKLGVRLFIRKPFITLTPEGILLRETFRQAEALEQSLTARYADLNNDLSGEIRLGTTEGRFRILMPDILSAFMQEYPGVHLQIVSAPSPDLQEMLLNNHLDLAIYGKPGAASHFIHYGEVLREHLYLVVSDNLMKAHFGEAYQSRKAECRRGADLSLFQGMPFALNLPSLNSSRLISQHCQQLGIELECVHVSSHPDLHHMMAARDYAACFCLTMYLPSLHKLNEERGRVLNIFPVLGMEEQTNPVTLAHLQNRSFPRHTLALMQMIRQQCGEFARYDLPSSISSISASGSLFAP